MKALRSLKVMVSGEPVRLALWDDDESRAVEALAGSLGRNLDRCPTCDGKRIDGAPAGRQETDSEVHWGFVAGQFKYHGEVLDCDCTGQMALFRHYMWANIPEQYMRLNWTADYDGNDGIKSSVLQFIDKWRDFKKNGMGLTLYGSDLGVGKTFAATTVAKAIVRKGERVHFMSFNDLRSAYQLPADERQHLEKRTKESTLLVLDEILPPVSDAQGEFFANFLETLIRHRTNWNLPTIITTNMEDELERFYPRVGSLLAPKQWPIHMIGNDQRRNRIAEENIELVLNGEVRPIT